MKALLLFFLLLVNISVYAQRISQENTEIFGYPEEYSEKEFMEYLNEKRVTQCHEDLKKIGFEDSYAFANYNNGLKYLLTLRKIPHYSFNPVVESAKVYPPDYVIKMCAVGLNNPENYYAYHAYIPTQVGDTAYVNSLNSDVNPLLVKRVFSFIKANGKELNQDSCLHFIRQSDNLLFKQAALLSFLGSIKGKKDIIKLFPLIMDRDIGENIAEIFSSAIKYYPFTKDDWDNEMFILCLNHPNVFLVNNLLSCYQKHSFPKEYAQKVTKDGSITIKEVLNGRLTDFLFIEEETINFLTYLTGKEYSSKIKWLEYLKNN